MRSKTKLVYGVGINDVEHPVNVNGAILKSYSTWRSMIHRCYDSTFHDTQPTYIGCSVCEEWHRFSTFELWFEEHYVEGWHLDKDLLNPSNKIYSPDTCIFVPGRINNIIGDPGTNKGEYPVGVSYQKNSGKFRSRCRDTTGNTVHLGVFDTPELAHDAYITAKLDTITKLKLELDEIDTRLYHALMRRYVPHPAITAPMAV